MALITSDCDPCSTPDEIRSLTTRLAAATAGAEAAEHSRSRAEREAQRLAFEVSQLHQQLQVRHSHFHCLFHFHCHFHFHCRFNAIHRRASRGRVLQAIDHAKQSLLNRHAENYSSRPA